MVTALSPIGDGSFLVAATLDRLIRLESKSLLPMPGSTRAHDDLVTGLSPDPEPRSAKTTTIGRVASASLDGLVRIWTLALSGDFLPAGRHAFEVPVHDLSWGTGEAASGMLSPIAAALDDGTVGIWLPGPDKAWALGTKGEPVRSVAWFPDGVHLASAGDDGVLRVWEAQTGAEAQGGLLHHYNAIRKVRVSSCGRYVAFLSGDEKGAIFDLERRETIVFGEAADPVVSLAWHPKEPRLMGGTERGRAFHYSVPRGSLATSETGKHLHPVEAAAWSAAGERSWTAGRDGRILAWELGKGGAFEMRGSFASETQGYALSVAWSPDGSTLGAAYSDGGVALWNTAEKAPKPKFLEKPHAKPVYGLAVSPDGKCIASGSVDKKIKVWDVKEAMQVFDLTEVHTKPVYGVSFSPDGRYLATGSGDTYLVVYDIAERKKKAQEAFGQDEFMHFAVRDRILNSVAWSPDGARIAVGLSNHTVVVLGVTKAGEVSKGPTLKLHEDSVSRVAWGPGGRFLVSAGYDRRVVVWDGSTYQPLAERIVDHEEPIQALAVHPGGSVIATGSWDRTIRLWDARDLAPIASAGRPHYGAVEGLDFTRDGRRLASASSDGTIGIWEVEGYEVEG